MPKFKQLAVGTVSAQKKSKPHVCRNIRSVARWPILSDPGPAGSTAGTLLAKHGWNVAIFEKEKFPRFKIGESLLPGSLRIFERMGGKEKMDQADVARQS